MLDCLGYILIAALAIFLLVLGWFMYGFLNGGPDITEDDYIEELWKEYKDGR